MSVAELIADLERLGIQLKADDDRLRFSPRAAVSPELAQRMKAHKPALLSLLRGGANVPACCPTDASAVWQAALDCLKDDPLFPPSMLEAMRAADAGWNTGRESAENAEALVEVMDSPGPCPECDSLVLWQSLAGNWRCLRCDPPSRAMKLAKKAALLKTVRPKFQRSF